MAIVAGAQALASDVLGLGRSGHIFLLPNAYDSTTGALSSWTNLDANILNGYMIFGTNGVDGKETVWKASLAIGTYTLRVIYEKNNNRGIVDFYIDAIEVGSVDMYDVGAVPDSVYTVAAINVATDGLKDIKAKVDGKNGASSNYYMGIQAIMLWRTA